MSSEFSKAFASKGSLSDDMLKKQYDRLRTMRTRAQLAVNNWLQIERWFNSINELRNNGYSCSWPSGEGRNDIEYFIKNNNQYGADLLSKGQFFFYGPPNPKQQMFKADIGGYIAKHNNLEGICEMHIDAAMIHILFEPVSLDSAGEYFVRGSKSNFKSFDNVDTFINFIKPIMITSISNNEW